jgi:hypothetical protein
MTEKDVPSYQIEDVFGLKVSKNGYRYDKKVFAHVVNAILELYTRVTRKHKVINGQINKSFTQGVIHWLHGDHLDWAKYAIYCGKYVLELKEMKTTNVVKQVEINGVREVK